MKHDHGPLMRFEDGSKPRLGSTTNFCGAVPFTQVTSYAVWCSHQTATALMSMWGCFVARHCRFFQAVFASLGDDLLIKGR